MIDDAAFSAYRLFELSHPLWNANKQDKRKQFLKELAMDLAKNHLINRAKKPKLQASVKTAMTLIGVKTPGIPGPNSTPEIQVKNTNFNFKLFFTYIFGCFTIIFR